MSDQHVLIKFSTVERCEGGDILLEGFRLMTPREHEKWQKDLDALWEEKIQIHMDPIRKYDGKRWRGSGFKINGGPCPYSKNGYRRCLVVTRLFADEAEVIKDTAFGKERGVFMDPLTDQVDPEDDFYKEKEDEQ